MHGWSAGAILALGVMIGVAGGFLGGRAYERAAHAWGLAIPRVRYARRATRRALGTVALTVGTALLAIVVLTRSR